MNRILLPEAKAEALQAGQWYEDRREGLGSRFLTALEETFDNLAADPTRISLLETIQLSGREIRRARVKKFPYIIVFEAAADEIRVIAISHTSRRPNYWIDRR
ncbi:MAG: type II toxin-antitoxin system RelE/ParE family toxin [Planctomycetaceae bacterium]